MVAFSWPNPFYQEKLSRAAHTPSHVTIVLDNTFDEADSREGSVSLVPSGIPPGYQTLSPQPPQLTPLPTLEPVSDTESEQEEPLPVPNLFFTQAPSNTMSVQKIYQRI